MSNDNNAIQVVERKLQLEIVVPSEPADLAVRIVQALNNTDGRFTAKQQDLRQDGQHILVKIGVRDQGSCQEALKALAHELNLGFRDYTTSSS